MQHMFLWSLTVHTQYQILVFGMIPRSLDLLFSAHSELLPNAAIGKFSVQKWAAICIIYFFISYQEKFLLVCLFFFNCRPKSTSVSKIQFLKSLERLQIKWLSFCCLFTIMFIVFSPNNSFIDYVPVSLVYVN